MSTDALHPGQVSLDAALDRAARPMMIATGLAYLVAGIAHTYVGGADREVIAPFELGTAMLLLGGTALKVATGQRANSSQLGPTLLVAVVVANNIIYHLVHTEAGYTPVLYLVTLALGLFAALPTRTFAALIGTTAIAFSLIVAQSPERATAWLEPALTLVASIVLAVVSRSLATGFSRRILELQQANDQTLAALDASLSHFRDIADMTTDLIAEFDDQGSILYANPAHDRLFETRSTDMIGLSVQPFIAEAAVDDTPLTIEMMVNEPIGPIEFPLPGRPAADGGPVVVEMSSRPFTNTRGERRVIVSSRDITARVRAEAAREDYRRELEEQVEVRTQALTQSVNELQRRERLATVGTLAAGIAHQINNPIGGILLSSQFAIKMEAMRQADTELLIHALRRNAEEAQRCGRIVKNLMRFARNDSADHIALDLAEIVERVVDLCRPYATSRRATLISNISSDCSFDVIGHSVEIEESIVNLIRNAVEAGGSEKTPMQVEISLLRGDDVATLVIRDDGRGMSAEDQQHVFDPFYTTRLNKGGTGLGLSVAREIALDHGGSLEVESAESRGTTMRFTLPLATASALANASENKSPAERATDVAKRRSKATRKPLPPSPGL